MVNEIIFKKVKKTIDKKIYMEEYRKNNADKWYKDNICIDCGGHYKNCGKTSHIRSMKHKFSLIKNQNDLLVKENAKLEQIKILVVS